MNMKITRGTTPVLNFLLPFSTDQIEVLKLTFMQNGEEVFTKSKEEVELVDLLLTTENGFITDENRGDEFSSNDANNQEEISEEEYEPKESYCNCAAHLTQEDTLAFKFWPAAEKNIVYSQFRIVDKDGEAYASDPLNFRIYGVLLDGKLSEGK